MKVYVLQHSYELDGADDVKLVGIYGSERDAERARGRVAGRPGFRDHPEGFSIDAYELGEDSWTTGFATVRREEGSEISGDRAA